MYYVVNGKVYGIAESIMFRLVSFSKQPSNLLEFDAVRRKLRRLNNKSYSKRFQKEMINDEKLKVNDAVGTVNKTDSKVDTSPFGVHCYPSSSRALYSFDDKNDLFILCCQGLEGI